MKIAVGCDHAGFSLKQGLIEQLREGGHEVDDLGTHSTDSVDYPDFGHLVATAVEQGSADRGLLICGTGIGMCMSANKHPGVRAAVVTDAYQARMTRSHNDANVLCIGERVVGPGVAADILAAFVNTEFEGGRHQRRVGKIEPQGDDS